MALMFIVLCSHRREVLPFQLLKTEIYQPLFRRIKTYWIRGICQNYTECDAQRGSVANVIREGLHKYAEVEKCGG